MGRECNPLMQLVIGVSLESLTGHSCSSVGGHTGYTISHGPWATHGPKPGYVSKIKRL